MIGKYILDGFFVEHDIRERTAIYVESVCGAQANVERIARNRPPNAVQCPDCAILRDSEGIARRRGRGISLPPKDETV